MLIPVEMDRNGAGTGFNARCLQSHGGVGLVNARPIVNAVSVPVSDRKLATPYHWSISSARLDATFLIAGFARDPISITSGALSSSASAGPAPGHQNNSPCPPTFPLPLSGLGQGFTDNAPV